MPLTPTLPFGTWPGGAPGRRDISPLPGQPGGQAVTKLDGHPFSTREARLRCRLSDQPETAVDRRLRPRRSADRRLDVRPRAGLAHARGRARGRGVGGTPGHHGRGGPAGRGPAHRLPRRTRRRTRDDRRRRLGGAPGRLGGLAGATGLPEQHRCPAGPGRRTDPGGSRRGGNATRPAAVRRVGGPGRAVPATAGDRATDRLDGPCTGSVQPDRHPHHPALHAPLRHP